MAAALRVFLDHTVPWQLAQTSLEAEEQTNALKRRLEQLQEEVKEAASLTEWWEIMGCFELEVRIGDLLKQHEALQTTHRELQEEHTRLLAEKSAQPPVKRARTTPELRSEGFKRIG